VAPAISRPGGAVVCQFAACPFRYDGPSAPRYSPVPGQSAVAVIPYGEDGVKTSLAYAPQTKTDSSARATAGRDHTRSSAANVTIATAARLLGFPHCVCSTSAPTRTLGLGTDDGYVHCDLRRREQHFHPHASYVLLAITHYLRRRCGYAGGRDARSTG
jgi:hypothetical protein